MKEKQSQSSNEPTISLFMSNYIQKNVNLKNNFSYNEAQQAKDVNSWKSYRNNIDVVLPVFNFMTQKITQKPKSKSFMNDPRKSKQMQEWKDFQQYQNSQNYLKQLNKLSQQIKQIQKQKKNRFTLLNFPSNNKLFMSNKSFTKNIYSKKVQNRIKIDQIRLNVVGLTTHYLSPFLIELEALYVDHTATNRPYQTIELIIQRAKKIIANPHTQFSHYGKFSTDLMHYSQKSLLNSFGVTQEKYTALPTGSGSTGAIQKTIRILKSLQQIDNIDPTVFITCYEHHSNSLPWIELYKNVQVLPHDKYGHLNVQESQKILRKCKAKKIIVSVSCASNVTSQCTPLQQLNNILGYLRQQGKNIIFGVDCAAFCVHHHLNLDQLKEIDFAYLSPHKNLGGSQSCGVLILKNSVVKLSKPTFPGGGTVDFVKGFKKSDVSYGSNIFQRQISGTPPFLGFYRAALSFQLQRAISYEAINQREHHNTNRFLQGIKRVNNDLFEKGFKVQIQIYGDNDFSKRVNVITFNFVLDQMEIIQHSLVSLILTDVFGIQLRSGCFCAGPFGVQLLRLSQTQVDEIFKQVVENGMKIKKPGYLRLDLTFYLQDYQIDYIVDAIYNIGMYWQNMKKIYQIYDSGEVIRKDFGLSGQNDLYSFNVLKRQVKNLSDNDYYDKQRQQLAKRPKIFEKQLQNGISLMKDPLAFLKLKVQERNSRISQSLPK